MSERKPNSAECAFGGYKLSNIVPEIEVHADGDIGGLSIGCEGDDSFYSGFGASGRVKIEVLTVTGAISIDLEDVLVFARKYCGGICDRVMREPDVPSK